MANSIQTPGSNLVHLDYYSSSLAACSKFGVLALLVDESGLAFMPTYYLLQPEQNARRGQTSCAYRARVCSLSIHEAILIVKSVGCMGLSFIVKDLKHQLVLVFVHLTQHHG